MQERLVLSMRVPLARSLAVPFHQSLGRDVRTARGSCDQQSLVHSNGFQLAQKSSAIDDALSDRDDASLRVLTAKLAAWQCLIVGASNVHSTNNYLLRASTTYRDKKGRIHGQFLPDQRTGNLLDIKPGSTEHTDHFRRRIDAHMILPDRNPPVRIYQRHPIVQAASNNIEAALIQYLPNNSWCQAAAESIRERDSAARWAMRSAKAGRWWAPERRSWR